MDNFDLAVKAWNNSQHDLKEFAERAAYVEGGRTKDLAAVCKCSVDRIENYRRAYRLCYELERELESPDIERMWAENNISFWIASVKLQSKHDLTNAEIYEHMKDGEGMTIEAYRAVVDGVCDARPEWLRRLMTIKGKLQRLYDDYMSEMPPDKQDLFRAAVDEFTKKLEELTNDSTPSA